MRRRDGRAEGKSHEAQTCGGRAPSPAAGDGIGIHSCMCARLLVLCRFSKSETLRLYGLLFVKVKGVKYKNQIGIPRDIEQSLPKDKNDSCGARLFHSVGWHQHAAPRVSEENEFSK